MARDIRLPGLRPAIIVASLLMAIGVVTTLLHQGPRTRTCVSNKDCDKGEACVTATHYDPVRRAAGGICTIACSGNHECRLTESCVSITHNSPPFFCARR
jgi:hypothetical protein